MSARKYARIGVANSLASVDLTVHYDGGDLGSIGEAKLLITTSRGTGVVTMDSKDIQMVLEMIDSAGESLRCLS